MLPTLFDHLVGSADKRERYGEAEHPGSLSIDDQFKLGCLHHGHGHRLFAFEHAARVGSKLTICIDDVTSIAHQAAHFDILAARINGRNSVAPCRQCQLHTPSIEKGISGYKEGISPLTDNR